MISGQPRIFVPILILFLSGLISERWTLAVGRGDLARSAAAVLTAGHETEIVVLRQALPVEPPGFPMVIRVSSEVLTRRIDKPVERTRNVRQVILGTQVTGLATTLGKYQVTLVPSEKRAMFKVTLTGRTTSRTDGRNGPVVIDTTTATDFMAAKLIAYDPDHGFYGGQTAITSRTNSRTNGVDTARRGFVKRIILRKAWEQIEASRHQANEIARRDTERQICEAFDAAIANHLAKLN